MESWKDQIFYLRKSIKKLSDIYGGDDPEWLDGYIDDVLKKCNYDVRAAQECCQGLLEQAREIHGEQFERIDSAERGHGAKKIGEVAGFTPGFILPRAERR